MYGHRATLTRPFMSWRMSIGSHWQRDCGCHDVRTCERHDIRASIESWQPDSGRHNKPGSRWRDSRHQNVRALGYTDNETMLKVSSLSLASTVRRSGAYHQVWPAAARCAWLPFQWSPSFLSDLDPENQTLSLLSLINSTDYRTNHKPDCINAYETTRQRRVTSPIDP